MDSTDWVSKTEEWLGKVPGYNRDILEVILNDLDSKTYIRFTSFFKKQILNCCDLQRRFELYLKLRIKLESDLFKNIMPNDYFENFSKHQDVSNSSTVTVDNVTVSKSSKSSPSNLSSIEINKIEKRLQDMERNFIHKYWLNSQQVGDKSWLCGKCPKDSECCDCSCADYWKGCGASV